MNLALDYFVRTGVGFYGCLQHSYIGPIMIDRILFTEPKYLFLIQTNEMIIMMIRRITTAQRPAVIPISIVFPVARGVSAVPCLKKIKYK